MRKLSNRKTTPTLNEEKNIWTKNYDYVIGIDEVGRGAFAGPVTVGAVVFNKVSKEGKVPKVQKGKPGNIEGLGINDSKLLTPQKREKLADEIKKRAQFYSITSVGVSVINKVGIGKATSIAFREAISDIIAKILNIEDLEIINSLKIDNWDLKIPRQKFFVLVDGFHIKYIRGIGLKHQKAIVKGDRKSISIAAASIIAKVYRDGRMKELSLKYPQYHFDINKGYGTKNHRDAIKKYGLSKIHRKSFNLSKFTDQP